MSCTTNADRDVFITPAGLRGFTANFLGEETDPRDPLVNPYYADLSVLPPAWFAVGGAETLLDSVHDLASRANAAGADVAVTDDMQHDFPVMAGSAPEADAAIAAAGTHLRRHFRESVHA